MTNKELAGYLRCSNGPTFSRCTKDCPYFKEEEAPDALSALADYERDGIKYMIGCDFDRICNDAADALERVGDNDAAN